MNAVLIEDEQRAMRNLFKLVNECNQELKVVAMLSSVAEAKTWFKQNEAPDVIISDIQLGDGKAFEIFDDLDRIPPVIFTTAYDEYAIKAFRNNGIDYLLKPFDPEDLEIALRKVKRNENDFSDEKLNRIASKLMGDKVSYKSRFMIKIGEKLKSVPTIDVACFYSIEGGTYILTNEKRNYNIDYTMDQLEEILDPIFFFRVNRKVITNYNSLDTIHMWSGSRLKIELKCNYNEEVVVSRERVKTFKKWLDR
jgi:DNA-binding LytR/AlgR family response regulator